MTLQTSDDQLQHQSPGIRKDGDRTLPSESRSTSDLMATTVSRSFLMALVKDIDQCKTNWQPPYGHYPVITLVIS
ncbi:hypothetical protein DPMN_095878 [Dreissena polymorpha]|uniref:Uncharacterized protein n=1 Tax=Dreissena polymorpha TaxID=45954 RepID=A0A9D4L888_DREPO|nr:hypothetical protein DPMN_095878 [Dreissena polymorpha]